MSLDIKYLNLIYLIKQYEPLDQKLINQYILQDNNIPLIMRLPQLFFDSNPPIIEHFKIKLYINNCVSLCTYYNEFNNSEKEWYKFYMLLKTMHLRITNIQEICDEYNKLPLLNTNKDILKWIAYQVMIHTISYYLANNISIFPIIKEIDKIPQNIKQFSY